MTNLSIQSTQFDRTYPFPTASKKLGFSGSNENRFN